MQSFCILSDIEIEHLLKNIEKVNVSKKTQVALVKTIQEITTAENVLLRYPPMQENRVEVDCNRAHYV